MGSYMHTSLWTLSHVYPRTVLTDSGWWVDWYVSGTWCLSTAALVRDSGIHVRMLACLKLIWPSSLLYARAMLDA